MQFLFSKRREEFLNQLNDYYFHEKSSTVELHITHTFPYYIVFETCSENFLLLVVSTVKHYSVLFLFLR